jgi:hypothetical protein
MGEGKQDGKKESRRGMIQKKQEIRRGATNENMNIVSMRFIQSLYLYPSGRYHYLLGSYRRSVEEYGSDDIIEHSA